MTTLAESELREKQGVLAMLNTVIEQTEFAMSCGDPFCRAAAGLYRAQAHSTMQERLQIIEAKYAIARAGDAAASGS